jgi:K+-sensing histidine kinase KdpD
MERKKMPDRNTMVCVTVQKTCERLIRQGAAYAGGESLHVLHVAKDGETLLGGKDDGEALNYLYRISREYGAEMDVLRAKDKDITETVAAYAKTHGVACIVLGSGGEHRAGDISAKLRAKLPGVDIEVV